MSPYYLKTLLHGITKSIISASGGLQLMEIPTLQILSPDGKTPKGYRVQIPEDQLVKAYVAMIKTRHIDARMITLQRQGAISFALSSKGEEACAVAGAAALEHNDWIYPQYRESGVMFWRGCSSQEYIDQMFGNSNDPALGRQMPNHYGSRALNVVTVSSPIGTKIPHAVGCAYAMKLQKEPSISISYFGDGASSEGDFHVGLSFAAVLKAPVIFFCRNNGYAISTPCSSQFATDGVAPEGIGHGIETHRIDGNDFFAIYDTVAAARKKCLNGQGPIFIEAMTYRMGAHSTSDDPTRYREEEEREPWKARCPLLRLRRYLESQNLWDPSQEEKTWQEIENEVTEAIHNAKKTPPPPLHTLIEHVYFEVPEKLEKQYQNLRKFFPKEP